MHILEQYALSSGLKIKKPFIIDKYFPIPFEKYITFHAPNKFPSRDYDYWKEVLEMIYPKLLENNIRIIQIGNRSEKLFPQFGYVSNGQTSINQMSYIISHAILHLGVDSLPIHFASYHQKKIVGLYCNMYKNHSRPYWSHNKDIRLIESHRNGLKPSYSAVESPKTINLIKPEEIANAIFDLLNIKETIKVESIYFGEQYQNNIIDMLPISPIDISNLNIDNIIVRMDKIFNLDVLIKQLNHSKCTILTNKPIDVDLLKIHKNNIIKIIFFIEKDVNISYLKKFVNLGINYEFISFLEEEALKKIKVDMMDFGYIHSISIKDKIEKLKNLIDKNLSFKSAKKTISGNQIYPSLHHAINKIQDDQTYLSKEFAEDLDFFYLFKK